MRKFAKGYYCLMCKRELTVDDIRDALCKRCETKPATTDYCVARVPCFRAVCDHRDKISDKPFTCCFKKAAPSFYEDLAKVSYQCESCGARTEVPDLVKHKEDCKPKFGGALKKICTKSGKEPHASD